MNGWMTIILWHRQQQKMDGNHLLQVHRGRKKQSKAEIYFSQPSQWR